MKRLAIGVVGLLLGLAALPAAAERSQVLFQFKNWVVEGVTAEDDSYSCRAKISVAGDSFAIGPLPDKATRLQFYSEDWDFGEGDTASLQVAIDAHSPWKFSGAMLLKSSVFVDIADQADGRAFVRQVIGGKTLSLRKSDGTEVRTYSLSGSSDAINTLRDCSQATRREPNPFK